MNQSRNCMMFRNLFETQGIDKLLLKIGYSISSVITVAINVALIRVLWPQRRRTRANKLFTVLSMSDIVVGMFTLPFTTLLFYTEISEEIYCKLIPIIIYAIFTPVNFSWTTTIVIAADRFLVITQRRLHHKYITDKTMHFVLINNFIVANLLSLWTLTTTRYPRKILEANPFTITLTILETMFISITAMMYIYLLYYVRRTAKVMKLSRCKSKKQKSYTHRTTKTAAYIFVCLVTCNVTQLVGMTYVILSRNDNKIIIRNAIFWPTLALNLNSFFNAVILICRKSNLTRERDSKAYYGNKNRSLLSSTRKYLNNTTER